MSASPQPRITPEEYLKMERAAAFRHEYYAGHIYAMSGGSGNHAILIAQMAAALIAGLKKKACSVTVSDLRLQVTPGGLYTYPDVMVYCGAAQFADGRNDTLTNPTVIAEVLSPSTEAYDRGFKFHQYKSVGTLQEYALVSQTEPRIDMFCRQSDGPWIIEEFIGLDSKCRFRSIDCSVDLGDLYERIVFNPAEPHDPNVAREPSPDS